MAVINKIELPDGTKPIIGYNEWKCEYVADDGFCMPLLFETVYENMEQLAAEEIAWLDAPLDLPAEDGFYYTTPITPSGVDIRACISLHSVELDIQLYKILIRTIECHDPLTMTYAARLNMQSFSNGNAVSLNTVFYNEIETGGTKIVAISLCPLLS